MSMHFNNETIHLVFATVAFIVLLFIIFLIYKYLFTYFKRKISNKPGILDEFILDLFKIPALWLIYWILLKIFTHVFFHKLAIFPYLFHINTLLLVFSIAWISIQFIKVGEYYLQSKLNVGISDNLKARKSLTQIKVFKGIANTIIIIIAIAVGLLTFKQARTIGISLLTSAGIIGIIVGFAAQKSLGLILAGIQLAIAEPIRLDDVVIVQGEWGRIEEINLTYVVIKIWDERRLIVPVTWFLDNPFQNWTQTSSDIIGTIFIYVDYSFPVESIRNALPDMLKGNTNWNEQVVNVQVTNTTEHFKEIRILLSSSDSSKNWNLRTEIREKLIDFINTNYPGSFAKIRVYTL